MIASIKMDIDNFFEQFRKKIDEVLDEATFIGLENIDELEDGTYTFLMNIVIYEIAKNNQLSIIPENPTGRGGYSDISLFSKDGKIKYIEIEHEK